MKKFVRIRTHNSSSRPLRGAILVDNWAICRLGSLTPTRECFTTPRSNIIEVNTVDAIQNSRSKLRMKACFATKNVPQSEWWTYIPGQNIFPVRGEGDRGEAIATLPFPLVVKRVFGFQGRGMELLKNQKELTEWLQKHRDIDGWYFEKFYNYAREYRLHVARYCGVILSWRKLRTKDAESRWFFNSLNSNWVGTEHGLFDKPKCWSAMEKAAIDCIEATGLDIGAVDIRVQSNTQEDPKFIVCEINSAPALGDLGIEVYKDIISKIIKNKANE